MRAKWRQWQLHIFTPGLPPSRIKRVRGMSSMSLSERWQSLSPEERREFVTIHQDESWMEEFLEQNRYESLWAPQPGPQAVAFQECQADVVGYGGAAGGGKTDLAL